MIRDNKGGFHFFEGAPSGEESEVSVGNEDNFTTRARIVLLQGKRNFQWVGTFARDRSRGAS
jgi:hypothetical protein